MSGTVQLSPKRETKGFYSPCFPGEKAFVKFNDWLVVLSSILVGLLTIPICADVFCRFVIAEFIPVSIDGLMELEIFALILFCFASMGYSVLKRATLQVDIVYNSLKPKTQIRLDIFANLIGVTIAAVMAWQAGISATEEESLTAVLRLPNSVFVGWTSFGLAMVAIACGYMLLHSIREAREQKDTFGIIIAIAAVAVLWALPFLYKSAGLRWSGLVVGAIGFFLLMAMLLMRVTIGLVMAFIGLLGLIALMRRPRSRSTPSAPFPSSTSLNSPSWLCPCSCSWATSPSIPASAATCSNAPTSGSAVCLAVSPSLPSPVAPASAPCAATPLAAW